MPALRDATLVRREGEERHRYRYASHTGHIAAPSATNAMPTLIDPEDGLAGSHARGISVSLGGSAFLTFWGPSMTKPSWVISWLDCCAMAHVPQQKA